MDSHWIFDAAYTIITAFGTLVLALIGLKIKLAILEVGGKISEHIAECRVIREATERRLEKLEERVEHGA